MQVAAVIEDVMCTFLEPTTIGVVNWHHNVHNVSNIIGAHVVAKHRDLVWLVKRTITTANHHGRKIADFRFSRVRVEGVSCGGCHGMAVSTSYGK